MLLIYTFLKLERWVVLPHLSARNRLKRLASKLRVTCEYTHFAGHQISFAPAAVNWRVATCTDGFKGAWPPGQGPRTTHSVSPPAPDKTDDTPLADEEELPSYSLTTPGSTSASSAAKVNEKKAPVEDIISSFSSLDLTEEPLSLSSTEACLARLKLL